MTVHTLKLQEPYFTDVAEKKKTFEIRKNDRDYKVGDILLLYLYPQPNKDKLGKIKAEITYILKDIPQFGLMEGYCILGIKVKSVEKNPKVLLQ